MFHRLYVVPIRLYTSCASCCWTCGEWVLQLLSCTTTYQNRYICLSELDNKCYSTWSRSGFPKVQKICMRSTGPATSNNYHWWEGPGCLNGPFYIASSWDSQWQEHQASHLPFSGSNKNTIAKWVAVRGSAGGKFCEDSLNVLCSGACYLQRGTHMTKVIVMTPSII